MTEKLYMACDDIETKTEYGPFRTSKEAEDNARQFGWRYVRVYTRTINATGVVTNVENRIYEITPGIDRITGAKPMCEDEAKFFAKYEAQMNEPPNFFERLKRSLTRLAGSGNPDFQGGINRI